MKEELATRLNSSETADLLKEKDEQIDQIEKQINLPESHS